MHALILCALVVLPLVAQSDSWKEEIDNGLVRATRRLVAPRETVSIAEPAPALLVFLTDYSVRLTTSVRQEELQGKRSQFLWLSGEPIKLENLSGQRLEVARVTPKFSLDSSYRLPVENPAGVVFENDLMRIRHIGPPSAAPRRVPGKLQHPAPSVLIDLSAGHLKLTHTDGRVDDVRVKAGDIWFQPENPFYAENPGESEGLRHEALRIELKTRAAKP